MRGEGTGPRTHPAHQGAGAPAEVNIFFTGDNFDLARDLIRLCGLEPNTDIEIHYTGVRPGEKLFEELLTAEEGTTATQHESIYTASSKGLPEDRFDEMLAALFHAAEQRDVAAIQRGL